MELTPRGREQARAWQDRLGAIQLEAVYSSDLKRCLQTAALAVPHIPAKPEPRLREIDLGQWEGLTVQEVQERFPGQWDERGRDMANFHPQGGESFTEVVDRAAPVFDEIVEQHRGEVLVVAHNGVIRGWLSRVLGMDLADLFSLELDYAGLSLVERRGRGWALHGFNLRPGV